SALVVPPALACMSSQTRQGLPRLLKPGVAWQAMQPGKAHGAGPSITGLALLPFFLSLPALAIALRASLTLPDISSGSGASGAGGGSSSVSGAGGASSSSGGGGASSSAGVGSTKPRSPRVCQVFEPVPFGMAEAPS